MTVRGVLLLGVFFVASSALADASDAGMPVPLACLTQWYPVTAAEDGAGGWVLVLPGGARLAYDDGRTRSAEERLDHPSVADLFAAPYVAGPIAPVAWDGGDPGRVRLEPLLSATYGATPAEVEKGLVRFKLQGKSVRVHRRALAAFTRVAARLDALVRADPSVAKFLSPNGGTVAFRNIAGTDRVSAHAYGIALDLNPALADYWRNRSPPQWHNAFPQSIVDAFEAEGFIWGGRWAHYDTMHFEWRPELACAAGASAPVLSYPWLGEAGVPAVAGDLASRVETPAGYARVAVAPGSFGAFLRHVPLAPDGTPAVTFSGQVLYDGGGDPNVAGIVAVDVGRADLQQCADSVIRMNAEWHWSRGDREAVYRTNAGTPLSFARYAEGYRVRAQGSKLIETRSAAPAAASRALYRRWLDTVFTWANTTSLSHEGSAVAGLLDVQPGDFMVMEGKPFGHAVLVLDVARADGGKVALLLAQGFMPAQSFQLLRPDAESSWFLLEPDAKMIVTPFWQPFPVGTLRRFP